MGNESSFMMSPYSGMGNWGMPARPQAPYLFTNPGGMTMDSVNAGINPLLNLNTDGMPNLLTDVLPGNAGFSDAVAGANGKTWFQDMIGDKDNPGWGGLALQAAGGAASLFMGMKQYGLAKKTLEENKRQFNLNYDAQKTTTNAALEDRQRARVASNPGAYQSVGEYMNQNGIK